MRGQLKFGFALLLFFYLLPLQRGTDISYWYKKYDNGYYRELGDAFLAGRLHFLRDLPPEFLAHPYECRRNGPILLDQRIFDLSFYKGRIYPYFGAVPALLLYAPFRLLTGHPMTDATAVLLFSVGAVILAGFLVLRLRDRYFPDFPDEVLALFAPTLVFANGTAFLVSDSRVYEVPIAAGVFFFTACLSFWAAWLREPQPRRWRRLAFGSLCLGLAVGCRPIYAVAAAALVPWMGWLAVRGASAADRRKRLLAIVLPLAILAAAIANYNYRRFDNPLEFGTSYQLTQSNEGGHMLLFAPERLVHNAHFLLFQPLDFYSRFPWAGLNAHRPYFIPSPGPTVNRENQGTVGALPGVPFFLVVLLGVGFCWACRTKGGARRKFALVWNALVQTTAFYFLLGLLTDPRNPFAWPSLAGLSLLLRTVFEQVPFLFSFLLVSFCNAAVETRRALAEAADAPAFPREEAALFGLSAAAVLGTLLFYISPSFRYSTEFIMPALLLAAVLWMQLDRALNGEPSIQHTLRLAAGLSSIVGAWIWISITVYR
ncbi:MAG TPA: hypothetical protein VL404_00755 [Candidatus Eisenbacteria bacterium]|nr:hypothetical protein [Candidatus Eisenbacteria bacterium]